MRLRLFFVLVCIATAGWANEKLGLEVDATVGPILALTDLCRDSGCPSPPAISVRAGYEFLPFGSLGLRLAGVLGPEGSGTVCGAGRDCSNVAGYRSGSVLLDARLHSLGATQIVGGVGIGLARLIRLQCNCGEEYDTHGSALPVLEIALGVRTYLLPGTIHVGVEARYSAMFGAESAGSTATSVGPAFPKTDVTVSSIGASLVLGASL